MSEQLWATVCCAQDNFIFWLYVLGSLSYMCTSVKYIEYRVRNLRICFCGSQLFPFGEIVVSVPFPRIHNSQKSYMCICLGFWDPQPGDWMLRIWVRILRVPWWTEEVSAFWTNRVYPKFSLVEFLKIEVKINKWQVLNIYFWGERSIAQASLEYSM